MKPTLDAYAEWQAAYDFYNEELFEGQLPECLMVLDNKGEGVLGYFVSNRFINSRNGEKRDCIAMNSKYILGRRLIDVLSTLVHEMVHLWGHHFGDRKSLRTYHNKEWGKKMESIGLMPSNTGEPGGKKTGQQMDHYIISDGPFERASRRLLANQFKISWSDRFLELALADPDELEDLRDKGLADEGEEEAEDEPKKRRTREKYTCPACEANIWGKPGLSVLCISCQVPFECVTAEP